MFNKKIMKQDKIFSHKVLLKLNRQKLKLFSDSELFRNTRMVAYKLSQS